MTHEDFKQAYSTDEVGRFKIVVRRGANDLLTNREKLETRALFVERNCLLIIVPAPILVLCIRKLRTPKPYDYAEFTIGKHLAGILRSVLGMTQAPPFRLKRK